MYIKKVSTWLFLFVSSVASLNCTQLADIALADIIPKNFVYHESRETIEKIAAIIQKKEKGAYLRFGDGDLYIAVGKNDILQGGSKKLQYEMCEAFKINEPNVVKALPLHVEEISKDAKIMCRGMKRKTELITFLLLYAQKLWGTELTDVYSSWAIPFLAVYQPELCINFLKLLKENNCYLLVGNKNIPEQVREVLFGAECKFVPTPSQNAYDQIDSIEKACLEQIPNDGTYKIIITSMGCAGRVLQKRLWNKLDNIFLFDFGSLMDALCGQAKYVRMWIRYANFDGKSFFKKLIQANNPPCLARVKKILTLLQTQSIGLVKGWLHADFDTSMGKYTKIYGNYYQQFLEQQGPKSHPCIDMTNNQVLNLLRSLFDNNNPSSQGDKKRGKIPKIIHQICIGPDAPQQAEALQKKLCKLHPDWEYRKWTEDDVAKFVKTMNPKNQPVFLNTKNHRDRLQILQYEILHKFGGVYIGPRFEIIKSLDVLTNNYDFFCGIDQLDQGTLYLSNDLIGTIPYHPILKKCIEQLSQSKQLGSPYFTKTILDIITDKNYETIRRKVLLLPATYFYPLGNNKKKLSSREQETYAVNYM